MTMNIKQRFAVSCVYILLISIIGTCFTKNWSFLINTNDPFNIVLITTALALVLGNYITEPYYSKPVDVITRWIAVFLFIIGIDSSKPFFFRSFWIYTSIVFVTVSLMMILLCGWSKFEKIQRLIVKLICDVSRPKIVFTLLYLDIVCSRFDHNSAEYPFLVTFGFLLFYDSPIIWFVVKASSLFKNVKSLTDNTRFIGQIISHKSPDLYEIEITPENLFRQKELKGRLVFLENGKHGIIGIVLRERLLVEKKWLDIMTLRDNEKNTVTINLGSFLPLSDKKSVYSKSNAVYLLDLQKLEDQNKADITQHPIVKNFERLIGIVWEGSTIEKIRFYKLISEQLHIQTNFVEGSIIETTITNQKVLYQVIDAKLNDENLENKDSHGFTLGTALKLGKYITSKNELDVVKWLPEIYTPVFLLNPEEVEYKVSDSIGRLPNTNYGIPIKQYNDLVTHNTAILGIVGIGKSCLTFELLQKLIHNTNIKVFCIDLTNQYTKELPQYVDVNSLQIDFEQKILQDLKKYSGKTGNTDSPKAWGNIEDYKDTLTKEIKKFTDCEQKRILILNPDLHAVEQPNAQFKITHNVPLSAAEKTRKISECIFLAAKSEGETQNARYLIVFEEAHSLIPEWNSVSNDGDKNASNGTAKVILQGRKYGLGSIIVTQRTANISKSILNQCNTVFALRVFDDTGKQFLENYFGSTYTNLLPSLEERHCIAIGKALRLKQPVIIELNNINDLLISS